MRRSVILVASLAISIGDISPAQAGTHGWANASNIGRDVLVAAALAIPAVQGDWEGTGQAGLSMAVAKGATYGLKEAFPETRPDGSNRKSFPSGHAAISFAAAVTLEKRYGWEAGIPALAIASFVAAARVEARKHHWYDAVAGAAVGSASGFLLTSPRNDHIQFMPWGDSKGGGLALAMRF